MVLIICISDYCGRKTYSQISADSSDKADIVYKYETLGICQSYSMTKENDSMNSCFSQRRLVRRFKTEVDGVKYFYLHKELVQFTEYRKILYTHLATNGVQLLYLQIAQPSKQIIDWKWNAMLTRKLYEKVETDYLMSWLSTLGGGFSALGEQFSRCAEVAGKISMRQLYIGIHLGDPFLQARCKLYYSVSLLQIGKLRSAKYIIRKQYHFAVFHKDVDGRLLKMCKGIWQRLQYEYGLKLKKKRQRESLLRDEGAGDK
ncbi:uncharacterized protein F58A4.6 [Glossina fuscipes]|uniref:Uncharacterized protein F58A4.6 n=2 Tax=Nemorhina TaxID=44051 RepID=A0A9C6DRR9_9MUSC|nr:uncharacterized protein F58A4.6 [Glossina fuscipes]KAI9582285.1 hypothetical protein GQX74_015408 [Glossina fuscipes]